MPGAPTLFVSPHLDDAVFACGERIAATDGALVVTVFAGAPRSDGSTEWDRASGFASSSEAIRARRDEDRRALARLNASARHLDFLDSQYGETPAVSAIADAIARVIAETGPRRIVTPLGLFHSDHVLASDASITVARDCGVDEWLLYAEALYRRIDGAVAKREAALAAHGLALEPIAASHDPERHAHKRRAIACYRSQLRALATRGRPGHRDALAPETLLRVIDEGAR